MTGSEDHARRVMREVEALYLNGPAGGDGVRTTATDVIGILAAFIDRADVASRTEILETS